MSIKTSPRHHRMQKYVQVRNTVNTKYRNTFECGNRKIDTSGIVTPNPIVLARIVGMSITTYLVFGNNY